MKANKFVKEFGLDSFKTAMLCPQFKRYNYAILYSDEVDFSNEFIEKHSEYMFKTSVIKRIVESHELVEHYKNTYGVSARWFFIANYCQEHRLAPHQSDVYDFVATKYDSYIADVESCK